MILEEEGKEGGLAAKTCGKNSGGAHHTGVDSLPCNALRGITPESTCQPQESNLNKVTVSKNRLTVSFLG